MNPELNPQDAELAKLLERSAQAIQPSSAFVAELEDKLNNSHQPQRGGSSAWKNIFPTLGWAVSLAVLALGLNWTIKTFVPLATPQPASGAIPTEALPQGIPYDFNGTPLYLNAPLPAAQADMPIYSIRAEQLATEESVRALTAQFHMQGQLYKTPGFTQDDFLLVDGNRRLQVRSDQYFTYYPDYPRWQKPLTFVESKAPDAEAQIAAFFSENGFNFPYSVEYSEAFGSYFANALNPDSAIIVNESIPSYGARFHFDELGIVAVEFSLLSFESVGTYGILSAEQALQIALSASSQRMQMSSTSVSIAPQVWHREYPFDEAITYWGYVTSLPSAEGAEQLVTIDGYTATGNISDVPANTQFVFVQVTGQFHTENGVRTFAVDSWSVYDGYDDSLGGRIELTAAGPQISTEDRGDIPLAPLPTGFPIPMENAYITGVNVDGIFEWKTIQDFGGKFGFGGGGGSGGSPFFLVNLSGTPVALPTPQIFPTPIPLDQMPTGQIFEDVSGTLSVNIRFSEDGTERTEYVFILDSNLGDISYVALEGAGLEELLAQHNRPLKVWGTVTHYDQYGNAVLLVERYEVPYPNLQAQILHGKITAAEGDGEVVQLFITNDGITYAMLGSTGVAGEGGVKGDGSAEMQVEVLIIPGETYAGYPAIRVFVSALAFDGQGNPFEMGMSSSEPNVFPEIPAAPENFYYVIEKVELVYYIADQRYISADAEGLQPYIQPVWRFTGHTSDGSVFIILVQALQENFLQPDPAFYIQPG